MKVLIIVAHGSKVKSSNDEIKYISENISNIIKDTKYDKVYYSFLELAKPSLEDVLNNISSNTDISEAVIFPYFLAAGKHVKTDIPQIIETYKIKSNIKFHLLPHFGKCNGIENLIISNS